jgi:hypothetical protein
MTWWSELTIHRSTHRLLAGDLVFDHADCRHSLHCGHSILDHPGSRNQCFPVVDVVVGHSRHRNDRRHRVVVAGGNPTLLRFKVVNYCKFRGQHDVL